MTPLDIALFILRIFVGISFIVHGWPKLRNWKETFQWLMRENFPLPLLSTIGVCLGEVFGGVFLILGIGLRPVSLFLGFIMIIAALYEWRKHKKWIMQAEVPVAFFFMLLVLLIVGGGALQIAP